MTHEDDTFVEFVLNLLIWYIANQELSLFSFDSDDIQPVTFLSERVLLKGQIKLLSDL